MKPDLSARYLGLDLANPLVASAGPHTRSVDGLMRLEQSGVAAAVLPSLFEEQIEHDELEFHRLYEYQTESFAESLTHFPEFIQYNTGPQDYLDCIEAAKRSLSIPVIASLNGHTEGGWVRYAQFMQEAGADALELNIYYVPTDSEVTAAEVEQRYLDLVANVKQSIHIPLAVKIGAQFSSLPNFASRLVKAGADGLVLFNRYFEPNVDLDDLAIVPELQLSQPHELRSPLRWIAILRDQLKCSLAASSGVHSSDDVLRALLVGADVAMMTSRILQLGPTIVTDVLRDLQLWLEEKEYESVQQLRGSMSRENSPDPSALERANYMKALISYTATPS